MTRRIYEFSCGRHITDMYSAENVLQISCHVCGQPSDRIISAPMIKLDAVSGDFPGATLKWENRHRKVTNTED